jgi:HSP20 family protein
MNRLFDQNLLRSQGPEALLDPGQLTPPADVYETPETFVFQVELPGISEDDVEIHAEVDQLTIRGERRPADTARPDRFHQMERSYGSFARTFVLPAEVDPSGVTAQFRDGLLRLEVRKLDARGGHS